jgi:hypothetical protein
MYKPFGMNVGDCINNLQKIMSGDVFSKSSELTKFKEITKWGIFAHGVSKPLASNAVPDLNTPSSRTWSMLKVQLSQHVWMQQIMRISIVEVDHILITRPGKLDSIE